jgi:hypothetical protein
MLGAGLPGDLLGDFEPGDLPGLGDFGIIPKLLKSNNDPGDFEPGDLLGDDFGIIPKLLKSKLPGDLLDGDFCNGFVFVTPNESSTMF